ncbi:MAG: hypothetical protein ACLFUP_02500 [Desulfobacteraceae bacterium]
MPISTEYFRKIQDFEPALRDALLGLAQELDRSREETVTRDEFRELRQVVKELGEAQQRTGARIDQLVEAQQRTEAQIDQLAEAQQRSEARLEQLAEAQQRTEARMDRLVEAQQRTEARVEELAEAQQRTEARVEELAEAQKRTEKALGRLTEEHRKTRQQVGGLSATVGYRLEDEAFKGLPALLKRDFGLELDSSLRRRFIADKEGRQVEVNIIGSGTRDGKRVMVLGEAKSQLSKRLINDFIKKKLNRFSGVFEEILPVLVTYMISEPDVEDYAREKGIALYYSYDL